MYKHLHANGLNFMNHYTFYTNADGGHCPCGVSWCLPRARVCQWARGLLKLKTGTVLRDTYWASTICHFHLLEIGASNGSKTERSCPMTLIRNRKNVSIESNVQWGHWRHLENLEAKSISKQSKIGGSDICLDKCAAGLSLAGSACLFGISEPCALSIYGPCFTAPHTILEVSKLSSTMALASHNTYFPCFLQLFPLLMLHSHLSWSWHKLWQGISLYCPLVWFNLPLVVSHFYVYKLSLLVSFIIHWSRGVGTCSVLGWDVEESGSAANLGLVCWAE